MALPSAFSVLALPSSEDIISFHLQNLLTVEGITGALFLLAVPVCLLMVDRLKWAVLAVLIHLCPYAPYRGEWVAPLTGYFQAIARFSQPASIALLLFLAVPAVRPLPWRRSKLLHPAVIAWFALQLVVSMRLTSAGFVAKGTATALIYCWMFLVLGLGLARALANLEQIRGLLRAVSGAAAITALFTAFLILVQPSQAFSSGRLYGTTANPQRLAALLALAVPYCCALVMDRSNRASSRIFHAAVIAVSILLVLGTGSRMGGLMVAVGLALFFRARLGALAVGGILIGAFAVLGYHFLGESISEGQSRIFTTTNTRRGLASDLLGQFMSSPLLGNPAEGAAGENGYLAVAAGYGLLGLLPMLVMLFFIVRTWVRTFRHQRLLGEYAPIGDLVIAAIGQLLVAWLLEAFIIGTLTDHTIMLYGTLGLMGVVEERLRLAKASAYPVVPVSDVDDDAVTFAHVREPANS